MSPSGFAALQDKDENDDVTWGDIQGLCKHFEEQISKQSDKSAEDINHVDLQLRANTHAITDMQTQMATLQTNITELTQVVQALRVPQA